MAKVLIVDDSAYARRVHRAILQDAGHVVVDADTGAGAIERFTLDKPDVVLLDLSMQDVGGLEVLRTIRSLDAAATVVVVSADVQRSTEEAVMAAGAARFVAKPADPARLAALVSELASGQGER